MSSPRNRIAFDRGQRAREEIRQAWRDLLEESPFLRITSRHILRRLGPEFGSLSERTVRWHMLQIAFDCRSGNSSSATEAA